MYFRYFFIASIAIVCLAKNLNAKAHNEERFIVEIEANNVKERSKIAEFIHIDSVVDNRVFSIVHGDDLSLLQKNFKGKISGISPVDQESSDYYRTMAGIVDFPANDQKFHTYDEMLAVLRKLEKDFSGVASVFSIGRSVEGKEIWAIKITGEASKEENLIEKPAIVYMGTHHAREHVSTEMPIMLAEKLLGDYLSDAATKTLINNNEIYIIPMVNPDGAMYDIEGQRYKMWRKNRRVNSRGNYGVDLNRNYGYGWGTGGSSTNPSSDVYMGPSAFSEPETKAIRDFFIAHSNVTIALSFHTFSELILYPWGGKEEGVGGTDEVLFKKMASDIAAMNHYEPMQSSELYIASGDTCDWLYGQLHVYCLTFELSPASMWGGGFYPGQGIIDQVFADNIGPMLYLANLAKDPKIALNY